MPEKHTPGPWRLHEQQGHTYVVAGRGVEAGSFVGQLIAAETTCPDWPANARLIAAAPDAHAILAAIHEFFRHHNPVDPSAMVLDDGRTLAQAVADYLAKATGP